MLSDWGKVGVAAAPETSELCAEVPLGVCDCVAEVAPASPVGFVVALCVVSCDVDVVGLVLGVVCPKANALAITVVASVKANLFMMLLLWLCGEVPRVYCLGLLQRTGSWLRSLSTKVT